MAIDLEALRRKVAELKGENRNTNQFKPALAQGETEHTWEVRLLPLTKGDTSTPCREVWFYPYDLVGGTVGTLKQRGQPDPVDELIQVLRKDYDNNKDALKQLYPKMAAFGHVIVRGQEDKGPQRWKLSKFQFQRVLDLMLDEDYGDVTDPQEGRDLKVKVSVEAGKFFNNKPSTRTDIDPKGKPSVLTSDKALAKKWMDSLSDPIDSIEFRTYDEIKASVDRWMMAPAPAASSSEGESRGGASQEKSASTPAVEKAAKVKTSKPAATPSSSELDAAFAELEADDQD